ncbi:unnamed protein product [Arctogadus glacialis]
MFVMCLLFEFSADTETRHKWGTAKFNNTLFTAAMTNPTSLITVDYTPCGEMERERGAVVDGADALRLMD